MSLISELMKRVLEFNLQASGDKSYQKNLSQATRLEPRPQMPTAPASPQLGRPAPFSVAPPDEMSAYIPPQRPPIQVMSSPPQEPVPPRAVNVKQTIPTRSPSVQHQYATNGHSHPQVMPTFAELPLGSMSDIGGGSLQEEQPSLSSSMTTSPYEMADQRLTMPTGTPSQNSSLIDEAMQPRHNKFANFFKTMAGVR